MDDREAQVGWTEAQWNRIREEVLREWQRTRVAGSILPIYGPLPRSTQVIPSEVIAAGGTIDDAATVRLLELSTSIELSRQQVNDDDLSGALVLFRRAATSLGRAEDVVVFNGQGQAQVPAEGQVPGEVNRRGRAPGQIQSQTHGQAQARAYGDGRDDHLDRFRQTIKRGGDVALLEEIEEIRIQLQAISPQGLVLDNPLLPESRESLDPPLKFALDALDKLTNGNLSSLGMIAAAKEQESFQKGNGQSLIRAITRSLGRLDACGYGPPYACVLDTDTFADAHTPERGLVMPSDRIEPMLGSSLRRASAIDHFADVDGRTRGRGVVFSMAGDALDLAIAVEATPVFVQIDRDGRYVFRVFERLALRIKDNYAIVRLWETDAAAATGGPAPSPVHRTPVRTVGDGTDPSQLEDGTSLSPLEGGTSPSPSSRGPLRRRLGRLLGRGPSPAPAAASPNPAEP